VLSGVIKNSVGLFSLFAEFLREGDKNRVGELTLTHGGEGGAASWEGGAVDSGSVNAFLDAALARVMRVAVPIPAVASASVFHSAAGG